MNRTPFHSRSVLALFCALALLWGSAAAAAEPARPYDTPESAAEALALAAKDNNMAELHKLFGDAGKGVLGSGDEVADAADRAAFAAAYAEKHSLAPDGEGRRFLLIGASDWPFPVPLVKAKDGRWAFDARQGADVLLARRIGRNELAAMQVCRAFVDAQQEYRRLNPEKSPVPHFAARIASRPGKRDGLYWETAPEEAPSPFGPLAASAEVSGYSPTGRDNDRPYHGYRYRVLTSQGANAPGGAVNYMKNGLLSRGVALLASPDNYGVSGVMSFIINQDGLLYEKNMGRNTGVLARELPSFNPDSSWSRVDVQ